MEIFQEVSSVENAKASSPKKTKRVPSISTLAHSFAKPRQQQHRQLRNLDTSCHLRSASHSTMPQEVSDIKRFIEICRRKDAKCKFSLTRV